MVSYLKAAGYDPTLFCLCNKHTLKIVPSKSPHHWDARIWLICKWDTFQTAQNWHPSQLVWDASNLWLLYPNQIQTEQYSTILSIAVSQVFNLAEITQHMYLQTGNNRNPKKCQKFIWKVAAQRGVKTSFFVFDVMSWDYYL